MPSSQTRISCDSVPGPLCPQCGERAVGAAAGPAWSREDDCREGDRSSAGKREEEAGGHCG